MSLERGLMLLRLNHELLPEPGRPMARTTVPLGDAGDAGEVSGTEADSGTFAGGASAFEELAAAGVGLDAGRLRPRPPRPRRRRGRELPLPGLEGAARSDATAASGSASPAGTASASPVSGPDSGSGSGVGGSSAAVDSGCDSKYAGCSGAGCAAASLSVFLSLSRIHLRMLGL
jgi:hypothetical protein